MDREKNVNDNFSPLLKNIMSAMKIFYVGAGINSKQAE
jgi:hypothetical protein